MRGPCFLLEISHQMESTRCSPKLTAPACWVIAGCLLIAWAVTGDAIAQSPLLTRGRITHAIPYCEVQPPCPKGCKDDTVNRICVEASR